MFIPPDAVLERPVWDPMRRTLWYRGQPVKVYRQLSRNQVLVVQTFQELGWPAQIDDPLPWDKDVDPKSRLRNTIKRLNRDQITPLLRFRADGTGTGILWEHLLAVVQTAS